MATRTMTTTDSSVAQSEGYELRHKHSHQSTRQTPSQSSGNNANPRAVEESVRDNAAAPSTAVAALERWNKPRANIGRTLSTFFSFFVFGMNDAANGALIPYLETYYDLSYTIVSLVFLSPFVGYSAAAVLNATIHAKLGQRGIAVIAPSCRLVTYVVLALHPPFPVVAVITLVSGFGNGLEDAAWCAWIGNMANANVVQGCLQAFYSLGATFSPLIATSMITQANLPWYTFYYVMIAGAAVELGVSSFTFWDKTAQRYRDDNPRDPAATGGRTREALKNRVTWICAAFFFAYVGAEVALGGWIVTFMLRVRSASRYASGISATGFWAGMALGRLVLGFVTERFGERLCIFIYLAIAVGLELIFWLVPQFIVSSIAVAFLGFVLGPLFPSGIVMATKLLPSHMHVGSIGFSTAIGGTGGAVFPFAVGAIAQAKGVKVLQPIILALLAVMVLIWISFPRIQKRD